MVLQVGVSGNDFIYREIDLQMSKGSDLGNISAC
jgi:hypothetical protein